MMSKIVIGDFIASLQEGVRFNISVLLTQTKQTQKQFKTLIFKVNYVCTGSFTEHLSYNITIRLHCNLQHNFQIPYSNRICIKLYKNIFKYTKIYSNKQRQRLPQ